MSTPMERCTFLYAVDKGYNTIMRFMVCDRPLGHGDEHRGRLFTFEQTEGGSRVLGILRLHEAEYLS